ncbi:hypothetical protein [Actinopolymorpha pittospori]
MRLALPNVCQWLCRRPAPAKGRRGWRAARLRPPARHSFQVLVYAGPDPLTGKDTCISESTRDRRQVERIRTRLLAKVDQQRTGSTKVTLAYTLDAWLQVHEADERTLEGYRGYAERTINPARARQGSWPPLSRTKPGHRPNLRPS